jgi:hypothetical protein
MVVSDQGSVSSTGLDQVKDAGTDTSAAVATQTNDAVQPQSSSGADETLDEKAQLLAVARDALKLPDSDEAGASSAPKADGQQAQAKDPDAGADGAADKDKLPPFHEHPRWKEMVETNRALSSKAQRIDAIEDFMGAHGLSGEQVAQGFEIMALIVRDPAAAREALLAQVARIDEAIGLKLPEDLRKKVDEGYVDEETALELSKARKAKERAEGVVQKTAEQIEAERAQAAAVAKRDAANAWEADIKVRDPDYLTVKKPLMDAFLKAAIAEKGMPRTAEEALSLVKSTYDAVTAHVTKIRPTPAPTKKFVQSTPVAGQPRPEPKTPLDVAKAVFGIA